MGILGARQEKQGNPGDAGVLGTGVTWNAVPGPGLGGSTPAVGTMTGGWGSGGLPPGAVEGWNSPAPLASAPDTTGLGGGNLTDLLNYFFSSFGGGAPQGYQSSGIDLNDMWSSIYSYFGWGNPNDTPSSGLSPEEIYQGAADSAWNTFANAGSSPMAPAPSSAPNFAFGNTYTAVGAGSTPNTGPGPFDIWGAGERPVPQMLQD